MLKIKKGDLVELVDQPAGFYHSLERTYGQGKGKIGIVTEILNQNMAPVLVEVTWNDGVVLKYYSDDLNVLNSKKD